MILERAGHDLRCRRRARIGQHHHRQAMRIVTGLGEIALDIRFLAAPLDRFFGLLGMIVWLLLNVAFGILATRWAMRGKGEEGSGTGTA